MSSLSLFSNWKQPRALRRQLAALALGLPLSAALAIATSPQAYAAPGVVVTIKPIHSLVAAVMQGIGAPELLIEGSTSPHELALKPSQAAKLQKADLIIWVGENLESALEKPLASLGKQDGVLELMEIDGLQLLSYRDSDDWGHPDHDDHEDHHDAQHEAGHADHEEHADHADHGDHEEADHEDGHPEGAHHHTGLDAHIWLSPNNAKLIAATVAARLGAMDPDNAARYQENARALEISISALSDEINSRVAAARGTGMIVFHDAYHYFEESFDLHFEAAVSPNPEVQSGASSMSALETLVKERGIRCIFAEPQFTAKRVKLLQEASGLKIGTLDPLGADLAAGPDLYPALLTTMADAISTCAKD
ncbi:zinc ABC transporter substrate-binding protein [Roseibium sp.]|uniref:zinc ABC transporter substrate-binding protein n=1 Tax=Roseibium sp. TaxID=1936156 RepID=UPI003A973746